ncbi:VrrA/YqfQ family protein [Lentibacillus jeotgali]|uniref:VrrA/YqfQ family protein n=1 Tax=Lentibacillus jeotgali TaxID=558169 RepID=UPI0002628BDC|nr:VrrA/YqfQ family protein [Lentibacillus jeotgali]
MVWPIQQQYSNSGMMPRQGFYPGPVSAPPQQHAPRGLQQFLSPQVSQSLLSPERISGFSQKLSNVQQVLNVVQQAAPLVQQYGPMVRNLPMLFKLMKAMNENDSEAEQNQNQLESEQETDTANTLEEDDHVDETNVDTVKSGESTPKLFI